MNSITGFNTQAPLYTKGIIGAQEYRVHIFNNKVIDLQRKRKKSEVESDGLIKNHSNGWVFCREEVKVPLELFETAKKAVSSLSLNFGAVDVLYSSNEKKIAVLEVNTAPGLEGLTLDNYANAILDFYENI